MRRFKALLYKDILLLIRDLPGLAMMFIMPLALVILMTYLQDSTFNSITENKIPLLLLDEDQDSLGISIERSIRQSHIFNVDTTLKEERLTASSLEKAVAKGDYQIGIVIPKNTTENIRQSIRQRCLRHSVQTQPQQQSRWTASPSSLTLPPRIHLNRLSSARFKNMLQNCRPVSYFAKSQSK